VLKSPAFGNTPSPLAAINFPMKLVLIVLVFLPHFAFSQPSDSVKKKAIQFQIRAFDAEQKHQFDSAILFADSSITLNNTRYEPYIIKAECLWSKKEYSNYKQVD